MKTPPRIRPAAAFAAGFLALSVTAVGPATAQPSPGITIEKDGVTVHFPEPRAGISSAPASPPWGREVPAASVTVEVETVGRTASGAMSANALAVRRVIDAAATMGGWTEVDDMDPLVYTEEAAPAVVRSGRPIPERRRITGYGVVRTLTLATDAPSRIGLLVDRAVAAGATRVGGLRIHAAARDP